jgi:hypothetical protein
MLDTGQKSLELSRIPTVDCEFAPLNYRPGTLHAAINTPPPSPTNELLNPTASRDSRCQACISLASQVPISLGLLPTVERKDKNHVFVYSVSIRLFRQKPMWLSRPSGFNFFSQVVALTWPLGFRLKPSVAIGF